MERQHTAKSDNKLVGKIRINMDFEKYPFEKLNLLLEDIEPSDDYEAKSLTIGEPQFQTPQFIQDELCKSANFLNKYPKSSGEQVLRDAMMKYLKSRFGLSLENNQLIPTFGTREVLFNFPQFLLSDAKSPVVVFPNPFYQIYEGAAKASNAEVIYLNLEKDNDFTPVVDIDALQRANLVILNTPNNPTGSVMKYDELKRWAKLALEYDFVLLNDECYVDLYLDKPLPSLLDAAVDTGNHEFRNILVINSVSKRSSAPGLRSGFIAGDRKILEQYMQYRTYVGCASPLPLQHASAVAWADQTHVDVFRKKYIENFEIAKDLLDIEIPEATFYIWLQVDDELRFTQELYKEYNVKVLPGSFLGRDGMGVGYVRLALVHEAKATKDILSRVAKFIKNFKKA